MAIDDLPLNHPTSSPPPDSSERTAPSPLRWIAVALGGLAAGALVTYWWMSRTQPDTTTPAPTTATDVAVGSKRPKRQLFNLPPLDGSDSFLAEMVSALSRHPTIARLMATPELVRGTTLAVVQIGDGRTPAAPLKVLQPASRLQILGTPSGKIDPKSYARWDAAVAGLISVSATDAAQLYVNVKPLFDQAYADLGNAGGDFDTAIVRAIETLGDTPDLPDAATLLRRTNYYEHEDLGLRALPPVQKQFILIGPDNRKKVMGWLTQFAGALDLKVN
jgi:hypothetical protein